MDNDTHPLEEAVASAPKPKKLFRYSFFVTSLAQIVGWGWLVSQHNWFAVAVCIVMIVNFSINSHMQHFNAQKMLRVAANAIAGLTKQYQALNEEYEVVATHMKEVHGMELEQGRPVRTMHVNNPNRVN